MLVSLFSRHACMLETSLDVTWADFEGMIDELCSKIPQGKYSAILALACGGLVPAYYIAKKLNINVVETVCMKSYDEKRKQSSRVVKHEHPRISKNFNLPIRDLLCVDDIVDSGKTIQMLRETMPNLHVATLFKKTGCPITPSYFVQETDQWVVLPWERAEPILLSS